MAGRVFVIIAVAKQEAREAFRWYRKRDERAAERFETALSSVLERAAETPEHGPVIDADVRRLLVRSFPYGVLYAIEPERVVVLAVMHLSRRPGYWHARRDTRKR